MKLIVDSVQQTLTTVEGELESTQGLYTKAAFEALSRLWLTVGWSVGYYLNFSWFGHAVVQIPEDLIRLQEVVYRLRPDVIVEAGYYRGGGLIFHATLCQALGRGRVIGIDLHTPPADRQAIQEHFLGHRITLIAGNSTSPHVVGRLGELIVPGEVVLVILDSSHTKDHVRCELELYSRFVTSGSYIIVADGLMRDLTGVPGGRQEWEYDNPLAAAEEFLRAHPEFEQVQPPWPFRDSQLTENVTHWPGGWLRRRM
jgi:cephalosporin hydroxylase